MLVYLAEAEAVVIASGQKQSAEAMVQSFLVDTYGLSVDLQTWKDGTFVYFFLKKTVWKKSSTFLGGGREETSRYEIPPRLIVGTALTHENNVYAGGHGCSHRTLIEVGTNVLEAKFGKPSL